MASRAWHRLGELASRVPRALWIVLGIGVLLRVVISLIVQPAMMNNVDTPVYTAMADQGLFTDPVRPAGYAMLLRVAHFFSDNLELTILAQHVGGILTALVIYATVRRIGAPVWAAVVAAAAILLSLDQIYIEHSILAESTFAFLLACALYACVRTLDDPRPLLGAFTSRHAWIIAAGVALGFAGWVRAAGAPLVPFLALWLLLAIPGSWGSRIGRAALGGVAAAAILLTYFALHQSTTGDFALTTASGRVLYGRVAPFADCDEFTPPAETRVLCEDTPTGERFGSDYYIWDEASPAWEEFGPPPNNDDALGEFGREVAMAQPGSYLSAVATDTLRHLSADLNVERASAGTPYVWMDIGRRDASEDVINDAIRAYYPDESLQIDDSAARTLTDFQAFLRVHPILMLECVVLGAFGLWLSSGRVRAGLALLLGVSVLLLVIPSVTATYNARYAVPIGGPMVAAGAIGAWRVGQRLIERGSRPDADAPSAS